MEHLYYTGFGMPDDRGAEYGGGQKSVAKKKRWW